MRVLVEPSDYVLRNAGDMAMMYVTISRLAALWPDASIDVFTADPNLLAAFCPAAIPLIAPSLGSTRLNGHSKRYRLLLRKCWAETERLLSDFRHY